MKYFLNAIILNIILCLCTQVSAQTELNDYSRIVINTYVPDQMQNNIIDVKELLQNKLNQITTYYGLGGATINPRFVLFVKINILTKDIIPGPPAMISQNLELNLYVADATDNTIFSSTSIELKGVGVNETKAFIEAIKTINPKNKKFGNLLDEGKSKIIDYYTSNCQSLISKANTLAKTGDFDAAILNLSAIPDVCEKCYEKSLNTIDSIYQNKIDLECARIINNAKYIWQSNLSFDGAQKVAEQLNNLSPFSSCQNDADLLMNEISKKLKADEAANFQLKMKKYNDDFKLKQEQLRFQEEESKRNHVLQAKQQKQQYDLQKSNIEAGVLREYLNTIAKLKLAKWRIESSNYIAQNVSKDYTNLKIK